MDPRAATAASALFRRLDRELWLLTARDRAGARRGGLIATFVSQASIVPDLPRVIVGIARHHHTWALIEDGGAFALHLIPESQLDWVWRFGLQSGHAVDKLDGLDLRAASSGAPILAAAAAWLDCRVEARFDTGDRTLYLAEVLDARPPGPEPFLSVGRLRQLMPEERRRELEARMGRDSAIDSAAIAAWRQRG